MNDSHFEGIRFKTREDFLNNLTLQSSEERIRAKNITFTSELDLAFNRRLKACVLFLNNLKWTQQNDSLFIYTYPKRNIQKTYYGTMTKEGYKPDRISTMLTFCVYFL